MGENLNAACCICGTKYHKCLSCKDAAALTPWRTMTDTAEHYKIYQILRAYSTGIYNKEDAKQRLRNVDLSDLEYLREHIKKLIHEIIDEEKTEDSIVKTIRKRKSSKVVETDDDAVPQ